MSDDGCELVLSHILPKCSQNPLKAAVWSRHLKFQQASPPPSWKWKHELGATVQSRSQKPID